MTRGHGVDELAGLELAGEVLLLDRARAGELGQVAADADVDEGGVGPQAGPDPAGAGLAVRVRLNQLGDGHPHGLARLLAHGRDARLVDEAELGHLGRDAVQRVAGPPLRLFLLGAVAEGAAGERAVLVEEAVDERLDRDRALARPQPLAALAPWPGARRAGPCRRPARPGCRSRARAPTAAARRWPPRRWSRRRSRLFSMKKQSGSSHADVRLRLSSTEPMLAAPSPK